MPDEIVLDVRNLNAGFEARSGAVSAVRDVSFTVRRGEKVAVVGESGCGKSTLALAILGLLDAPGKVFSGDVLVNGTNMVGLSDRALSRLRGRVVSLVFQDPMSALDPIKTIGTQIVDTLRRHKPGLSKQAARERAVQLLREVEVPAPERRLDDYPHQYSGGMRQRVMIAIAMANEPDLIIADEPTTALDVTTQAQVLALLERIVAARGVAVLMITHNLGVVSEFADIVQVMYAGQIVERGTTVKVLHRPGHPYTEALLQSMPRPGQRGARLTTISGMPPQLNRLPSGCPFEPRCVYGEGRDVCRNQAPPAVPILGRGKQATAACHFIDERLGALVP